MAFEATQQTTVQTDSVTIADDASLSDAINCNGRTPLSLTIPATWVTATVVTFQMSHDGSTFYNVYYDDNGTLTELSVPVAASAHIRLDPKYLVGVPFLKIRSGTAASPVNQTEDAGVEITLVAVAT